MLVLLVSLLAVLQLGKQWWKPQAFTSACQIICSQCMPGCLQSSVLPQGKIDCTDWGIAFWSVNMGLVCLGMWLTGGEMLGYVLLFLLLCFKAKYLELCRINAEGLLQSVPLFRLPPASLPIGAELAEMSWDPSILWQLVLYRCHKQ